MNNISTLAPSHIIVNKYSAQIRSFVFFDTNSASESLERLPQPRTAPALASMLSVLKRSVVTLEQELETVRLRERERTQQLTQDVGVLQYTLDGTNGVVEQWAASIDELVSGTFAALDGRGNGGWRGRAVHSYNILPLSSVARAVHAAQSAEL